MNILDKSVNSISFIQKKGYPLFPEAENPVKTTVITVQLDTMVFRNGIKPENRPW